MQTKLVILDRDGTINQDSDDYVKSADEWIPLPDALEAIARLNHAGWHVVVASNQSGLGRGLFDVAALNAMHTKMHKLLAAAGGRIDACFIARIAPKKHATAASPCPVCTSKSANAMAWTSRVCTPWAIRCATCKPARLWAAPRIWYTPAKVPSSKVKPYLLIFRKAR